MLSARLVFASLAGLLLARAPAAAQPGPPPPADYADPAAWLCRPDKAMDACRRSDQDATVVQADGATRIERFHADPRAPIDCFYVYPTGSLDPGGNAGIKATHQEIAVAGQQFARFGSVCRTFAPLYRQVTLTALRVGLAGHPVAIDRDLPYQDVKAAWDYYLAHYNRGRGVVLIGHSQGSLVLAELVKKEIDGRPVQRRILSIILAGYRLQVPVGKDVGGDFKSIPLCRAPGQIGCVITFASFRATNPPPADAKIFAASAGPGLEAACVNPAALGGGSGPLHAYLASDARGVVVDSVPPGPWTNPPRPIATPFVEVPGLLSAECRDDGTHDYLAIAIHPSPGGRRTGAIIGDVVVNGRILPDWGLHIIDLNLTIGNLVDIVRAEGRAYLARGHQGGLRRLR
ncbi:MAG TPA: DUF3089 domain-containing protein [Allosphingosinicella sp.]|nr:DUF3089 domain-containing protein [Allosphingosinicella sp.]